MKKSFYYILLIINVISIVFCLFNLHNISNELIFLPLLIIAIFELFLVIKRSFIMNIKLNRKIVVMSISLCVLFFIMLPITSCLNKFSNNITLFNIMFKTIFLSSLFLSLFYIFVSIFSYEFKESTNNKKIRVIIMSIITIISLLFIASTSTGFYDVDFPDIWHLGNDGWWSNWHTFGFGMLIHFCKIVFNNTYLVIILNFILYLYFCNYSLEILERQTKNKNILILFLCINIFTIVGFDQLRYILKDTLFSLGFCIFILTMVEYFTIKKFTKKIVINMVIFSIIMILFRHGTLYLLILIFLSLFIIILKKKQYFELIYIGIVVIGFVSTYSIINYIGFNILHSDTYFKSVPYTVPIYQIGAFANSGYEFSDIEKEYLEQYLPIEYMATSFKKNDGDALARINDEKLFYLSGGKSKTFNYSGLIGINLSLFIKKPIFYMRSLFDLSNILWKIENDNNEYFTYLYKYSWEPNAYNYCLKQTTIMYKETKLNSIVDNIVNFGLKSVLFDLRTRGAFPLFMLLFSVLILINKRKYNLLLPILFILFWYALLFISLPKSICRYCLPFINIYPFIFCLSFGIKEEKRKNN